MIALPMMVNLFIGFVTFELFLNLYIIEIVLSRKLLFFYRLRRRYPRRGSHRL